MNNPQTDNSYFEAKKKLRLDHLPDKDPVTVLDCYSGTGRIWNEIAKSTKKKIRILPIDKEKKRKDSFLQGDNLKFLASIDLSIFDIIDLDAYGVPFRQLDMVLSRAVSGQIIFITFIQSMFGTIPLQMLKKIGYPESMVKKCPSLFSKNGFEKFKQFLCLYGIRKITHFSPGRKHYIFISK